MQIVKGGVHPFLTPDRLVKRQNGRRFKNDGEPSFTINTQDRHGILTGGDTLEEYKIRKLTPKECWRLMGFADEDFEKAEQVNSATQLYKQAGNSIVVDVLYYIYMNLYKAMPYLFDDLKVGSFFSGIGAFEKGLDSLYVYMAEEKDEN